MQKRVMFFVRDKAVAIRRVVSAMPVVSPFRRGFLEDIIAFGTEDVIAEAEVFVENHSLTRDQLVAIFATSFVRT